MDLLIERPEGVTTSDLATDIKVLLAKFSCAAPGRSSPLRQSLHRDLGRLVDTDGIEIEGSDRHTGEGLQLGHDLGSPLSETVLD